MDRFSGCIWLVAAVMGCGHGQASDPQCSGIDANLSGPCSPVGRSCVDTGGSYLTCECTNAGWRCRQPTDDDAGAAADGAPDAAATDAVVDSAGDVQAPPDDASADAAVSGDAPG
ncbi:MAG: hypothetical protein ACLP1X_21730 [Polyangiaceae bacterium]